MATVIKVTLTHLYRRGRVPFTNYYECQGPDGTVFTNSSKAELKRVLTRKYGRVELEITDLRRPVNEY